MIYWLSKLLTNGAVHRRAFSEVACVVIFSFIPLVVSYFVQTAGARQGHDIGTPAFSLLFGKGQVFLLAYGLFGSIFWLAFLRGDRERHDARVILGALATILMFPIVGFIGVDPTFSTVVNPNVIRAGWWFYAGFAIIYYLLLFYMEIEPPTPDQVLATETGDLIDSYNKLPRP